MPPINVVCPNCDTVNRVPAERLASQAAKAVCGKCKARLFQAKPVAIAEAGRFRRQVERSGCRCSSISGRNGADRAG